MVPSAGPTSILFEYHYLMVPSAGPTSILFGYYYLFNGS